MTRHACPLCALGQSGHTFERKDVEAHLAVSNLCPISGIDLRDKTLVPNHALRNAIQEYLAEKAAASTEQAPIEEKRAPTPSPLTPVIFPVPCGLPSSVSPIYVPLVCCI